jgi:hypothetical protein
MNGSNKMYCIALHGCDVLSFSKGFVKSSFMFTKLGIANHILPWLLLHYSMILF